MRLRYTPAARADLAAIRDYIRDELKNPSAVKNITSNITRQCSRLKEFPMLGGSLEAKLGIQTKLRFLVCGNHLAFYLIEDNMVSIIRILDGRTDYIRFLSLVEGNSEN